jgi:hypothetical protein
LTRLLQRWGGAGTTRLLLQALLKSLLQALQRTIRSLLQVCLCMY